MRRLFLALSRFVSVVRAHPRISQTAGLSLLILTFVLLFDRNDLEVEEFEFFHIDIFDHCEVLGYSIIHPDAEDFQVVLRLDLDGSLEEALDGVECLRDNQFIGTGEDTDFEVGKCGCGRRLCGDRR